MTRQCGTHPSYPGADVGPAPTWRGSAVRIAAVRIAAVRVAVVLALALWAPAALAQKCSGLAVTNMVFTGFSPFGPGVAATSTLTYSCDPGVTQAWIGIFDKRALSSGGNALQFDIYEDPAHSIVWPSAPPAAVPVGANVTVTAYGFLPPQDAAAGTYSGTQRVVLYTGPTQQKTDQVTLTVSAVIASTCTIGAGALAFGSYDPIVANASTPLDAQGAFQVACTRNTTYAVGLGQGSFAAGPTRQMASGAQRLAYELYSDPGRTSVWNTAGTVAGTAPSTAPITLTVYGRVPAGQGVAPGAYADTVQSTINF